MGGLASAATMDDRAAEVAVWVDDAWQRRGVGSLLFRGVLSMLGDRGVAEAIAIVEPGNVAVRRMIARVTPRATTATKTTCW